MTRFQEVLCLYPDGVTAGIIRAYAELGMSTEAISEKVLRSVSYVEQSLDLHEKLHPEVLRSFVEGKVTRIAALQFMKVEEDKQYRAHAILARHHAIIDLPLIHEYLKEYCGGQSNG